MRASESIAEMSSLALSVACNRMARDAEPMQKQPRQKGRGNDRERDEPRARQVEQDFRHAGRCSDPGKRDIHGSWHAVDYAQSAGAIP